MCFYLLKRKARPEPATTAQFFLIASGRDVKIPLSVLDLAPSSSLHDDARIHATRGHPTARRLERRRRGSAGEVVPAGATGIAPTRPSLRRERAAHTLQTTAILNEAYLRLVDLRSSSYFFLPMRAANRSLSFPRARASRDMTVPGGICAMSAISLYERPSWWRSARISRNSAGNSSIASLISSASSLCCRIVAGFTDS